MPIGTVRRRLASVVWSGTGRLSFIRAKIDRVNPSACRSGRSKAAATRSTVSIARSEYWAGRPRVRLLGAIQAARASSAIQRPHIPALHEAPIIVWTSWSRGTLPSGSGGGGVRCILNGMGGGYAATRGVAIGLMHQRRLWARPASMQMIGSGVVIVNSGAAGDGMHLLNVQAIPAAEVQASKASMR